MSDLDARTILEGSQLFTEFKGALTEQYVYQQITAETEYTPYYFSANSHTEIDFLDAERRKCGAGRGKGGRKCKSEKPAGILQKIPALLMR